MISVDLRPTVAVHPPSALALNQRLFELLGVHAGVRFSALRPAAEPPLAIVVVGSGHERLIRHAEAREMPVAAVAEGDRVDQSDASFTAHPRTPRPLRGVRFAAQLTTGPVKADVGTAVLASTAAGAVWTCSHDGLIHRVGAPLPRTRGSDVLRTLLGPDDRRHGLVMLALIEFLRQVLPPVSGLPELRATLLFDDPNLRLGHYGHIDYRRLVDHADAHGYHASIAMIPIDAGRAEPTTVQLFRDRGDRLSLVMHGNDHRRQELLRADALAPALRLGAQALRRIDRFESATGLPVGRVMVPPHGMCSREVAAALGMLGFDCLCSLHPAPWTERPPADMPLAGVTPATFIDGCAVIPRLPLDDLDSELATRAYLGQPLVLYGHHDDLAGGYEVLARTAARVNALGDVRWCSLPEIALTNHQTRTQQDLLEVVPWSNRVRLRPPPGISRLTVVRPARPDDRWIGLRGWRLAGEPGGRWHRFGDPIAIGDGAPVTMQLVPQAAMPDGEPGVANIAPVAWARRRATELRDRAAPYTRAGTHRAASV